MSPFSRYHFQGQRETEEVLRIIHRHWLNITLHYLNIGLLTIVNMTLFVAIPILFPDTVALLPPTLLPFAFSTFLLFLWIYAFLAWIDYYFDIWIITSERIVNIEQKGFFNREVSELQFSRIQDVTSTVEGLLSTFFNFGNVYVQTAAEQERFVFQQIPDPYVVKDMVMRLARANTPEEVRRISETVPVGKRAV